MKAHFQQYTAPVDNCLWSRGGYLDQLPVHEEPFQAAFFAVGTNLEVGMFGRYAARSSLRLTLSSSMMILPILWSAPCLSLASTLAIAALVCNSVLAQVEVFVRLLSSSNSALVSLSLSLSLGSDCCLIELIRFSTSCATLTSTPIYEHPLLVDRKGAAPPIHLLGV